MKNKSHTTGFSVFDSNTVWSCRGVYVSIKSTFSLNSNVHTVLKKDLPCTKFLDIGNFFRHLCVACHVDVGCVHVINSSIYVELHF